MNRSVAFIMLFSMSPMSVASADVYRCEIKTINYPADTPKGWARISSKSHIGQVFMVDTKTGVMSGALRNDIFKMPEILNYGDAENSFVVATIVSPLLDRDAGVVGTDTRILRIRVWSEGRVKPFTLMWDDDVYRGDCEKLARR